MKKIFSIIVIILAMGCARTNYVRTNQTLTNTKIDTIYINRWGNDSIVYKEKNDTIYLERYKTIFKDVYKTEFKERIDTVKIEVIKEIIKKVPNQAFLYILFPVLFLLMVLVGYFLKLF